MAGGWFKYISVSLHRLSRQRALDDRMRRLRSARVRGSRETCAVEAATSSCNVGSLLPSRARTAHCEVLLPLRALRP